MLDGITGVNIRSLLIRELDTACELLVCILLVNNTVVVTRIQLPVMAASGTSKLSYLFYLAIRNRSPFAEC